MEIAKVNDKPVELELFKISNSLVFALKSISGDSENEIITYFYNIGITLLNDVLSKKKLPMRCNRSVKVMYKDTNMLVRLDVWTSFFASKYQSTNKISLYMTANNVVTDLMRIDKQAMSNMLAETGLGLSDNPVLEINKPDEKVYKCLQKKKVTEDSDIDWSVLPKSLKDKHAT